MDFGEVSMAGHCTAGVEEVNTLRRYFYKLYPFDRYLLDILILFCLWRLGILGISDSPHLCK